MCAWQFGILIFWWTKHRFTVCSLKVKKQTNGSSGQMLTWISAAQMMVQRLTAMPPCTQGVGVGAQRAAHAPGHSDVLEEEVQRRDKGQILITEGSELASAAGCRKVGMLRMRLMKKRTWKRLRRYMNCHQSLPAPVYI